MKKILSWMLVVALTAAIAVGGTLAYLTDTDEDVNVMTLGNVKIDQLEYERVDVETKDENAIVQEFHDNKPLYPAVIKDGFNWENDATVDWSQIGKDGYTSNIWDPEKINNEQDKMVFVKNKGDYDAYVRSIFAFEANGYTLDQFKALFHLNINETDWTWKWEENPVSIPGAEGDQTTNYIVATATYNKVLKPGELTEISLSQIALDPSAGNEDIAGFGDTYQILVKTQAIQADGFSDPETALNDGFKEIAFDNIPWENDSPIRGIDVRTALHNLNGDTTKPITDVVMNVIFGLNKDYPAVVDGYEGTLVDEEQDVDVYSYYVPNGSGYDVYFLSDDKVFLPKNSNGLFRNMKQLVSVTPGNMDVSRVETMRNMFRDCQKLPALDTTTWDTGKVNDMGYMFQNCYKLKDIQGIENWDTSNVTFLKQTFYNCNVLGDLDLSAWETGKVTDMEMTFAFCKAIKEINCANWDVSNVTNMVGTFGQCFALEKVDTTGWKPLDVTSTKNMFFNCYKLNEIVGSGGWVMPVNTNLYCMFQNCNVLTYLDATNWDLSSAQNMYSTFWKCLALKEIEGTENWNLGNVTNLKATFEWCTSLEDLDVSTWNTGSVTTMSHTFYNCMSLETLDVSNWYTGNVTEMNSMFSADVTNSGDMSFTELDVSEWDTGNVKVMNNMFHGCSQLKELDLSKWDVSKVTTMSHMFSDCYNIESIDFTGWNTVSLTSLDGIFNDCRSIKVIDLSDFDTATVEEFAQVFEACTSLEYIIGLDQWDTSNGTAFDEMFNGAYSLKELDLSSFDTSSAKNYIVMQNGGIYYGFSSMFNGVGNLQKLKLGDKFIFSGNGSISDKGYPKLPNPAAIDGQSTLWYNAETGDYYTGAEIPEQTAATYVAAVKPQG